MKLFDDFFSFWSLLAFSCVLRIFLHPIKACTNLGSYRNGRVSSSTEHLMHLDSNQLHPYFLMEL